MVLRKIPPGATGPGREAGPVPNADGFGMEGEAVAAVGGTSVPRTGRRLHDVTVAVLLLGVAAAGWWWSARMASVGTSDAGMPMDMRLTMSLSLISFVLAWAAMMAAMMFPAIIPVVRLYRRAATRTRAAPTPLFLGGYLAVWTAVGVPVWWVWRALAAPLANGVAWAGRAAGGTLLLAAAYQLTPLKRACLRQCRSPMGFFLQLRGDLRRPRIAAGAGARHGMWCLGCCWALMTVLVAVGTMNLLWMAVLTAVVFAEKVLPRGDALGRAIAVAMLACGLLLVGFPATLEILT